MILKFVKQKLAFSPEGKLEEFETLENAQAQKKMPTQLFSFFFFPAPEVLETFITNKKLEPRKSKKASNCYEKKEKNT